MGEGFFLKDVTCPNAYIGFTQYGLKVTIPKNITAETMGRDNEMPFA